MANEHGLIDRWWPQLDTRTKRWLPLVMLSPWQNDGGVVDFSGIPKNEGFSGIINMTGGRDLLVTFGAPGLKRRLFDAPHDGEWSGQYVRRELPKTRRPWTLSGGTGVER